MLDLVLEFNQALQERLRRRRASRHVHVHRDVLVDAAHDIVAFLKRSAAGGAGAHRNDVPRLGHLVEQPHDIRHHLLGDRAGDDHQVCLARRGAEQAGAEAVDVEARGGHTDHFDGAARQPELHGPNGRLAAPVIHVVEHVDDLAEGRNQHIARDFFGRGFVIVFDELNRPRLHESPSCKRLSAKGSTNEEIVKQ